ncbi:MAG: ribonuclease III domain-containing protein [Eubacteriales bacterium]|nr:ribonuclease III domain-containing protein [Eubacteriales bacterium]MDD3289765.1 ribonuclease III domain-containing protein [Eubacteriales bacterium]MDD3864034.1 ribonuclease III domain-containing protein [Eubacteriales bacterium]
MTAPEKMNTTALAYLGDAIYETYIREHVIRLGVSHADRLHRAAVPYVCAQGQAKAVRRILPSLTEEEQALVRRARNRKSATKPRHADAVTYKWATAFEALIGYLYLSGRSERLETVLECAATTVEDPELKEKER